MTDKQNPEDLLEYPCQYQFKAVGAAGESFKNAIVHAIGQHAAIAKDAVKSRLSGKGTYQSVSVLVTLHSYPQLTKIYAEIRQAPGLKMLI